MLSRRIFILLLLSMTALSACVPKKNSKQQVRPGRTRGSPTGASVNGQPTSYTSGNSNTQWGTVTGSQNFDQAVYLLAQTSLAGASADDQLGTVSPQAYSSNGGISGIFFWGAINRTAQGSIDANTSKIHFEIFDSKYGSIGSNGQPISQLFLHIGPEQQGFLGVQAFSQTQLVFSSETFSVMLEGNMMANPYQGTIYFLNANTSNQWMPLGTFSVPRSGFFNF